MGVLTPVGDLHRGCSLTASECHASPSMLDGVLQEGSTGVSVEPKMVSIKQDEPDVFEFCWDRFEAEVLCQDRMSGFVEAMAKRHPTESVLCISHGGPTGGLFERLMGADHPKPSVGMTSVFVYVEKEGSWTAPVVADQAHLEGLEGNRAGPNDISEQQTKKQKTEHKE